MSQHEFRKDVSLVRIDPKNYWKSNDKKEPTMKQMIMVPLALHQKEEREERALICLIIPSNLMAT